MTDVVLQNVGNYPVVAKPRFVFVNTDASNATITAAGWLNSVTNQKIEVTDIIVTNYASNAKAFYTPAIDSNGVVTLSAVSNPGEVTLIGAAVDGNVVKFSGTTGDIADAGYASAAVARWAGATVIDNLASFNSVDGEIEDSGIAKGAVATYAGATVIDNLASFNSITGEIEDSGIVKTDVLQESTLVTDYQQIVGINEILIASVGTWTRTRVAQGNYVLRHTAADDTSVIGIDITHALRTTASRGFRLASIDVIYSIGTAALDAHTLVLDKIAYANNVAVAVTSVPLTGSLSIATQANPYVTNIAVTTPAFNVTADSKYVLELTVDAALTSDYDFYGLCLRFTKSVA